MNQPKDGYTLFIGASGVMSIAAAAYPNLPYHPTKTFVPLTMIANFPLILVTPPELPIKNVKELVAYAKAHPDEVFPAVGKQFNIEPGFFKAWFTKFSDFPVVMSDQDVKAIGLLWEKSKGLNILKSYPPVEQTIWKDALTEKAVEKK